MHVAVGSTNPVKRAAVERVLDRFDPTITPVVVDSGVAEQPRSLDETVRGARARARRAFATVDDVTYGVGLEGGVARFEHLTRCFLIMWAAVTDGRRVEVEGGPSLRLPDAVARRLDDGAELGPVLDDVTGTDGAADGPGAAGVFTGDLTDRTHALSTAVACAFGPFVSAHYDSR